MRETNLELFSMKKPLVKRWHLIAPLFFSSVGILISVLRHLRVSPRTDKLVFVRKLLILITLMIIGLQTSPLRAQKLYNPIPLPGNNEVKDTLSDQDIPTGEGGFARDYLINLEEGDQLAIDLNSDDFDALVILMASDGSTIAENDDGPDGSTNALLFARITESGKYIIRVRAFGETGSGKFTLKVSRLRPVK